MVVGTTESALAIRGIFMRNAMQESIACIRTRMLERCLIHLVTISLFAPFQFLTA
jgi:hypothetical protein